MTQIGPHHLSKTPAILTPAMQLVTKAFGPGFYESLDGEFEGFVGHSLIQIHAFESAWPTWEMHPKGDELVCLIEGDVDFVLRVDGEDQVVRVNEPGSYVVVPKGIWHTARPHTPTKMLFVTPGEGTQNEESPPR